MAEIGQLSYSIILNDKDFNRQALEIQKKLKNVDAAITGLADGDSKKIAEPFNVAGLSIDRMIAQAKTLEATFKALSQNGMGDLSVEAQNLRMRWQEIQAILQKYGYSIRSSTMEQQTMIGALRMQENTVGHIELKMKALASARKNINVTEKESIETLKRVNDEYMRLGDTLKKVGARQYNLADLARNTNGAFSPLGFSIQQVARELPSLTMGAQMFFLAISNNLPILSDELRKAKASYAALVAEGKTAVPVWKQVVSSIFSWQTAMVVGITLLTMYGREIGNWVKGLFGASKANDELNSTVKETSKSLGTEKAELDFLFKSLNNAKKGTDEYTKAKNKIIDQFGKYYNTLELEKLLVEDSAEAYKILANSIYEAAKAQALKDSRGKAGATLVEDMENNMKDIRSVLISSLGEDDGRKYFMKIRKEIQETGKVSQESLNVLNKYNQALTTQYGGKNYDITLNKQKQSIEIAVDNIDKAQKEYNATLIESEELLGDLFSGMGDDVKEVTSLIKEAEDELKRANLMPSSTESEIAIRNKEIKKWQDEIKRLNELGIPQKKDLSSLNSMAKAEERLSERQRKIENENIRFELEMRQKAIGIMEDSYAKKYAQLLLNNQKELQAVKEHADEMIVEQQKIERATWQAAGSKGVFTPTTNSVTDLPKETQEQMKRMFNAISSEFARVYYLLNKEEQDWLDEANMMFADSLQKRLFDINKHYRDEFLAAKGNLNRIAVLRINQEKEVTQAILDEDIKRIEFRNEIEQKRIANSRKNYTFEADKEEEALKKQVQAQQKIVTMLERKQMRGDTSQDLADRLAEAREEQAILNNELANIPLKKAKEMRDIVSQTVSILGELGGFNASFLDGFTDFAITMSNPSAGLMAKISAGLSAASGIISSIIQNKDREAEIQREINKLQNEYNASIREQNYNLIQAIDYSYIYRDNIEALNLLIRNGIVSDKSYGQWGSLFAQWKTLDENVIKAGNSLEAAKRKGADFLNELASLDAVGPNRDFISIAKDWQKGSITTAEEALRRIAATGMKGASDMADEISRATEETEKWNQKFIELSNTMSEYATGTDFDSFLDSALDAISNLETGISGLGEFTEETLRNAVLSSFKYKVLSDALKPMYDDLSEMFLSDNVSKSDISDWSNDFNDLLEEYYNKINDFSKNIGVDLSQSQSSDRTGLSGSLARASQESIDELTGVMYAGLEKLSLTSNGINAINITTTAMSAELKAHTMLLRSIDNYSSNLPYMRTGIETMVNQGVRIKSV